MWPFSNYALRQIRLGQKAQNKLLILLLRKVEEIMAIGIETQKVIDDLNAATTAIAVRIEKLIADKDLSAEEKAAFGSIVDSLKALGTDPENPVP